MSYCQCNEITLYYENHGEGWPLLLISGLGGGSWSYYGQVPFFSSHYRTVTYDNRGAGRSGKPLGPYTIQQMAEDALCLLDHLEIDKAFVLGLSMGGMIAQELALLAPKRVRGLFLGCTHCGGPKRVPPSPQSLEILLNNTGLSQEEIIRKNLPIFFSGRCLKEQPQVVDAYIAAQLSAPEQPDYAFRAQLAAIASFDCSDRLRNIKVPVMIVAGEEDVLVPPENARLMAKRLPQAEVVLLPGVGHALHAECCDKINDLAHSFFKKVLDWKNTAEGSRSG